MPSIFRRRSSSSRSLAQTATPPTPAPVPPVPSKIGTQPTGSSASNVASAGNGSATGTAPSTAESSIVLVSPPTMTPTSGRSASASGNGNGSGADTSGEGTLLNGAYVKDPETMDGSAMDRSETARLGKGVPSRLSKDGGGEEGDGRKRKGSLSRTRKRLSSIFRSPSSSSSLAARASSPAASPAPSLGTGAGSSLPTPSSGGSGTPRGSMSASGNGSGSKPPPAPSAGAGVGTPSKRARETEPNLAIPAAATLDAGSLSAKLVNGMTSSGASSSYSGPAIVASAVTVIPGLPRARPTEVTPAPTAPSEQTATSQRDRTASHGRSPSLYSEWSTDGYDIDDVSDDEVYATPPEGLSEVEEEDDEDDARSLSAPANGHAVGANKAAKVDGLPHRTDGVAAGKAAASLDRGAPEIKRAAVESVPVVPTTPITPISGHAHLTTADQAAGLASDIQSCQHVIELFLTSRMKEAERFCYAQDPTGEKMYLQNAAAVIQCIKGMMTFDQNDLSTALEIARKTSALAHSLRKPQSGLLGRVAGVVRSGSGIAQIQAMNLLEKHAELVYAESLLIKAVLGIVAGGDWLGLIKEALNMRTAHGIYRQLQSYLDHEAKTGKENTGIDEHFKSGVELGTGLSSLMLSLMPGKALRVAELFGYAGNRDVALATLMAPGGWSEDASQTLPQKGKNVEGVRRPVCDMALLTFHLVIPILMPIGGVNVPLAKNILKWNLERYPNGIFFMYFKSRLHTTQSQPEMANDTLQEALDLKLEYLQLQHMCLWDMGVNNMMLCDFSRSRSCFEVLTKESNWSKAVYLYSSAACAAEMEQQGSKAVDIDDIGAAMHEVPKNTRKIAGKSLPIEKYVTRKARKYLGQGNRLMLPGVELGYFFGALANTPPRILYQSVIPLIQRNLAQLESSTPEQYGQTESEYWEDFCLVHFLLGVAASFAGYPHAEAVITEKDKSTYSMAATEAAGLSKSSFESVLANGNRIQLDHWLVYFTHFELGRLYSQLGDNATARHHLQIVVSGKAPEAAPNIKGKYSMESALALKVHAAMQVLKDSDTAKML